MCNVCQHFLLLVHAYFVFLTTRGSIVTFIAQIIIINVRISLSTAKFLNHHNCRISCMLTIICPYISVV